MDLADARPVLMVTGAFPPDVCGVGDYVERLMAAAPDTWRLFVERDWSIRALPGILRRLFALAPADVIVQYPTQGYGWSLGPHLVVAAGRLTRRYRAHLALHEYSSLSRKARVSLAMASHFAECVIFTTDAERDRARSDRLFSSTVPTCVIGILSNIPSAATLPAFSSRTIDLGYFGHIRPNKGLEAFLDVVAAAREIEQSLRIAVIGEVPGGYEDFARIVAARCEEIGCDMVLGLDDEAVGATLSYTRILYLPFPDGISARRGSVLAGLSNGAIVASSVGRATPPALLAAIIPCVGHTQDAELLLQNLAMTDRLAALKQEAGRVYVSEALPRDWHHVAILYEAATVGTPARGSVAKC